MTGITKVHGRQTGPSRILGREQLELENTILATLTAPRAINNDNDNASAARMARVRFRP